MATELVPFTQGFAESSDQTVGAGAVHTLIPATGGSAGKVVVKLADANGGYVSLKTLNSQDKYWQLQGPLTYKVQVRRAGCDIETGGG